MWHFQMRKWPFWKCRNCIYNIGHTLTYIGIGIIGSGICLDNAWQTNELLLENYSSKMTEHPYYEWVILSKTWYSNIFIRYLGYLSVVKIFSLGLCDVAMSRQCMKHERFNKFIKALPIIFQLTTVCMNLKNEFN